MSVSSLLSRRRLVAAGLALAAVSPLVSLNKLHAVTVAVAAPSVAIDKVAYDGRLDVKVRLEKSEDAKSLRVTGVDGEPLAFSVSGLWNDSGFVEIRIAIRPKDTSFRVSGAGVDATLETPPMFFVRPSGRESPGDGDVFSVRLRFTQRLDATQPPPRVSLTPAVPGVLVHIDGNDVVLTGKFPTRTELKVRFDSDVRDADGRLFKAGETTALEIGPRRAGAEFAFNEGVLSPKGSLGVPVKICNLPKVVARVATLDRENLVPALHDESMRNTLLETAAEKEIVLKSAPDAVVERLFDVRTSKENPETPAPGVRLLKLSWKAGDYEWQSSDESFVTVTDLAISVATDGDGAGLSAWVTGIASGKPVAGAEVVVRSAQNRVLARGVTDASGLVKLAAPDGWLVVATKGDDLAYARLSGGESSGDGPLPVAKNAPGALFYADRGVHRGGDTVRLAALVRGADGAEPPATPMEFRLSGPDGRLYAKSIAKRDAGGFFFAEFPLSPDVPYGAWRATLALPGSDAPMAKLDLRVSAFEPLRLATTLEPPASRFGATASGCVLPVISEAPAFVLESKYRFGSPAAGLVSTMNVRVAPVAIALPRFPGFVFGYDAENESRLVRVPAGPLDDKGARTLKPDIGVRPGIFSLACSAQVVEPGGRTDTAFSRVLHIASPVVVGLKDAGTPPVVGKESRFSVALAGPDGAPVSGGDVTLTAERVIENWTLQRQNDGMLWRRTVECAPAGNAALTSPDFKDGVASAAFVFAAPGEHRLVATTGSGARTVLPVFVAGPGEAAPGAAPHLIVMRGPSGAVSPGGSATVAVDAPFSGDALLTLESDRVLETRVVNLKGAKDEIRFTMPADARGSVWVSLREIRPLDAKQPAWKPVEARGRVMVRVAHDDRKLGVVIDAPAKAVPETKTTVVVRVSGTDGVPAAVHCWAVDTGVLDITGYKTPDVFGAFLGPKASAVRSLTTYDSLLPDFARTLERIGAGDGAAVYRGNGMKNRKPVAVLWSGVALTDAKGELRREIKLPDHTGEIRWMAVAAQGDRYGSGEAVSKLARPVSIGTSAPAFLAPGDTLRVPVALFDNTGVSHRVRLSASLTGVEIVGDFPKEAVLPADGKPWRGTLVVRVPSKAASGEIVIAASGDFEGGTTSTTSPLNIRSATPLRSETRVVSLKPGDSIAADTLAPAFEPGSMRTNFAVSDGPKAVTGALLASLVDYPYGCVEQTSSRLVALAASAGALPENDPAKARSLALMRAGLGRLALNLRGDGGLGYWPESRSADPEGTRLAAEAMVACAASGGKPDASIVDAVSGYLRRLLYATREGPDVEARLCATLAGLGKPEENRVRYLAENAGRLDASGIAFTTLALARSGDVARAKTFLTANAGRLAPATDRSRSGRYESAALRDAAILDAFLAAAPEAPEAEAFAASLSRFAAASPNTCEAGAIVGALSRYATLRSVSTGTADVAYSDGVAPRATPSGFVRNGVSPAKTLRLTNRGTGPATVVAVTTGTSVDDAGETYAGLRLTRRFLDAVTGAELDLAKPLRVGDAIRVELTLAPTNGTIPDVALCDMLPACFETEGAEVSFVKPEGSWEDSPVARSELREDRALAFVTVAKEARYTYTVRVVAAGRFALPPPQAASMYDPAIRAEGLPGVVVTE